MAVQIVYVDTGHGVDLIVEDTDRPDTLEAPCRYCRATRRHVHRCPTCGAPPA